MYRKKFAIYVERVHREKTNGATVPIPIHPSNVIVTKLKLDKDRKNMLLRKGAAKQGASDKMEVRRKRISGVDSDMADLAFWHLAILQQ